MNWVERSLLILLVLGVWALVLKPVAPNASPGVEHDCTFEWGGGRGELIEGEIVIHNTDASVTCRHYWSSGRRVR